jgi:hypothetical protein
VVANGRVIGEGETKCIHGQLLAGPLAATDMLSRPSKGLRKRPATALYVRERTTIYHVSGEHGRLHDGGRRGDVRTGVVRREAWRVPGEV